MRKKTIAIKELKEKFNDMIAREPDEAKRELLCYTLAYFLHRTGNYQGFNHLDWLNGGSQKWNDDGRPEDTKPYCGPEHKRLYF